MGALLALMLAAGAMPQGTPPRPLVPGYGIDSSDYPAEAMALDQEGRVVAQLALDETGAILDCEIAVSSGSEALDAGTCPVLRRKARFAPSLDEAGRPQPARVRTPINWLIADDGDEPVQPQSMVVTATFGPDLVMGECSGRVGAYSVSFSAAECRRYAYLFPSAALRKAFAAGARGVRATAERREEYAGLPTPPAELLRGEPLARVSATFAIDASGRATSCVLSDQGRVSMLRGGLPCRPGHLFDVAGATALRFPIRATWTTTTVYTPLR